MALNLRKAGHEAAVWSHNSKKAKAFAQANELTLCANPEALARESECAFICVGDTEMSRRVILETRDCEPVPPRVR